jgi:hypothetical protein
VKSWLLLSTLLVLLLAACSDAPKKRVFPPEARLQQVQRLDDGQLRLQLRLHNYSNVPMRLDRLELSLEFGGSAAGRLSLAPAVQVTANSIEIVEATLRPEPEALQRIDEALASGTSLRYRLGGSIVSGEPRASYPIEFASALDRVPGLDRVLR